jgi:DNA primase
LGYSPELKNAFTQYALEKGYSKEILENSGLSIFPENTPSGIDRFRERIIFPIQSFSGRIIGFGARILKSNIKTAKYLNSPETEIYHKSNVLYGLNQSKQSVAKENLCLLVEGYMDVVSLHQAGIENVVASSGTALTVEQIKLIKRLTENVTILFDGDTAGIKASFRSIDLLLQQGMNIRVLLFPDGHDPDSFAKAHPRDFVDDFIKKEAKDFIDFKAEVLLKEADNDPIKKAEAIRDIVRSIAFVSNSLKQEVYLQEVSNKFSLSQQSLFNELGVQNQIVLQNVPKNKLEIAPKLEIVDDQLPTINPMLLLEEKLVELMLKYGDRIIKGIDAENNEYEISVIEIIINHLLEDNYELQTPLNKKIVHEIEIGIQENSLRSGEFFATLMDEEISTKVADALIEPYQTSNWEQFNIVFKTEEQLLSKIINDVIMRHKREYILKLIDDMKSSLQSLENKDEVYTKIISLNQLKRKIDEQLYRVL